ncbi:6-pyruvoyl trahydropterin synthase family protein [Nesterenkonia xinjiangensis]|uniref:6-carboxy-5,6,7,8-tetrahydropterin synthase n=1 Tax=Nesterenkonia xinjiangensis TaxID=225327 RepID=A0A7Z0GN24_9MICC|nr:6-carboxytetrahydropterin synthase [Nesterenkonia xinjiangensis]NYJ79034.1 6-pyruvoyl-tetrahydropterin synthase [Nesterenkonia xinjiangensis]
MTVSHLSAHMSRFRLTVDDHLMIAHSLDDPFFGPAQRLHGATLHVHATYERPGLDTHGVVMDIGAATDLLAVVLEPLRHQNLDELPAFENKLSTTEVIIAYIAQQLAQSLPEHHGLTAIEIEAGENPRARASVRLEL